MKISLSRPAAYDYLNSKTIVECVGNTPLLDLSRFSPKESVRILAKAEWFNPGGSVKDRAALYMVRQGEERGELTEEKVLLDSTSGNTGIAYAWIAAALGYRIELVVPANISPEKKSILRAYGVHLTFSDPLEGSDGAQRLAQKIVERAKDHYFMPDQYSNPANPQAHYETTGMEILEQTQGAVTHFVAGIGTSGTLMGTGRRLKEENSQIQVIGMEPKEAVHGLEGLKNLSVSLVPGIFDAALVDARLSVETEESYAMCEKLAATGLLVGYSSGAALVAAQQVARRLERGVIVTIFPDSGDRYLSQPVFQRHTAVPPLAQDGRSKPE